MPNMAATPITMWKWPTTNKAACRMISMGGGPGKNPLPPPLTNIEMKPNANREAELMRSLEPYRLKVQISTTMVAGMVMTSVGKENASEENGFIPLTNM